MVQNLTIILYFMMLHTNRSPLYLFLGLVLATSTQPAAAKNFFKHLFKHHCRYCVSKHNSKSSPANPVNNKTIPPSSSSVCSTNLISQIHSSSIPVPGQIGESNEDYPVVIVPQPDGQSVLAWSDTSQGQIRLARVSADDQSKTDLPPIPGLQVQAGLADPSGTVLAVISNDPDIYSPKHCKSDQTPDQPVCGKIDLVKLTTDGSTAFRTTLSSKINADQDGANFIWWYGHTARLASDGNQYAVYYRTAGSYTRPNDADEVDIHAGDALRFVSKDGTLIPNAGWSWGCSHSWSVRLAFSNGQWAAACHGDAYPNAMQMALLNSPTSQPIKQQWLNESNPTGRALGGIVAAPQSGFWMNYIVAEDSHPTLHLAHYSGTTGQIDRDLVIPEANGLVASPARYPYRAYMAAYRSGQLLLGWKTADGLKLAVADASTGQLLQPPVSTNLQIDDFDEFVSSPSGDVLWATSPGDGSITINRVAGCH